MISYFITYFVRIRAIHKKLLSQNDTNVMTETTRVKNTWGRKMMKVYPYATVTLATGNGFLQGPLSPVYLSKTAPRFIVLAEDESRVGR